MLGRDHALSGGVVFAAAAPFTLHVTLPQLITGTVLTGGAALLSDFDEPGSTIARGGGFLTRGFAHVVRWAARGHRHGTHSLLGAAVFTLTAWAAVAEAHTVPGRIWLGLWLALLITSALRVLPVVRGHVPDIAGIGAAVGLCYWHSGLIMVPVCVGTGVLAHIAGDSLTHGGCPWLWPVIKRDFHLLPVQFTTGKFFEHWVMSPLLSVALALLLARDAGGIG